MSFRFHHHRLFFHKPAKTSRDVLNDRDVYFVRVSSEDNEVSGFGECAPIWGLSRESKAEVERTLANWTAIMNSSSDVASVFLKISSIRFAVETALRDLANGGRMRPFDVDIKRPIPINGLVWMADARSMLCECREKIDAGFSTIKLKVGALNFDEEVSLLKTIRKEYATNDLEIRLDANGAFFPQEALEKLSVLSDYSIHSIEQPLKAGQWDEMARLAEKAPIPIALDEELIGLHDLADKQQMLEVIRPHYIILKPTLHGSFSGCDEWISLAEKQGIGWWVTSALESNVGLNAIAQWVLSKNVTLPQGLGTGGLYSNNIESPWVVQCGMLRFDENLHWNLKPLML